MSNFKSDCIPALKELHNKALMIKVLLKKKNHTTNVRFQINTFDYSYAVVMYVNKIRNKTLNNNK